MGNSSYSKAAVLKLKTCVTSGDLGGLRELLTEIDRLGAEGSGDTPDLHSDQCTECAPVVSLSNVPCAGGTGVKARSRRVSRKTWLVSQSLNRRGDTALNLSVRLGHSDVTRYLLDNEAPLSATNKEGESALDLAIERVIPEAGDILRTDFYPPSSDSLSSSSPTSPLARDRVKYLKDALTLITHGAKGPSLHKLILSSRNDPKLLRKLADCIPELDAEENYRLSGLLLQIVVWFELHDVLVCLLERGVDPANFWRAPFIPTIIPNADYRRSVELCESLSSDTLGGEGAEYVVSPCPADKGGYSDQGMHSANMLQSLKLSFVQDWRADWYDGDNPEAQYRAGLLLTPDGATYVIRSANNHLVLDHVVDDVITRYLHPMCGGPLLGDTCFVTLLMAAGYRFSDEQVSQLTLKYKLDMSSYMDSEKDPHSLKQLCRVRIRFCLTHNAFKCVPSLRCLPKELRNYLLLYDIQ